MIDFNYWAPTRYTFGKGAELNVGTEARRENMTKVLLVYGQGSVIRSGLLDRVKKALDEAQVAYVELGGVQPNPFDDLVYKGIEMVRENGCDGVIAVGGGSVIDTAKAIAGGALYDGDFWDFYVGKAKMEKALSVGVILTIPAAGSEGSGNSVITKRDGMHKISVRTDHVLRPKFSLLNPEVTFTLPPYQTAAGIVDMMAHIFERYYSPTEDVETTDRLAEGLLRAIIAMAPRVMADPSDYQARANIMWAGTQAHNDSCGIGRVQDWASHGLEHELSALYGVTHGAGLAVVNPAWMTYAAKTKPAKIAQMARRVFDVVDEDDTRAALEGIKRLKDFYKSIGMPVTLAELGVKDPDIDALVKNVHVNKGTPFGAYINLYPEDTRKIYGLMRD